MLNGLKSLWMQLRAGAKKGTTLAELEKIKVPTNWRRLRTIDELADSVWYQTDRRMVVTLTLEQHLGRPFLHATLARPGKAPSFDDALAVKNIVFGAKTVTSIVFPTPEVGAEYQVQDVWHIFAPRDGKALLGVA